MKDKVKITDAPRPDPQITIVMKNPFVTGLLFGVGILTAFSIGIVILTALKKVGV